MSVYTVVSKPEMEDFLRLYAVGMLAGYSGINEGIENTNYFVDTRTAPDGDSPDTHYVLTIFEWQDRSDLPYFLDLMAHAADVGLPCPHPIVDKKGSYLQTLCDKPAALITRLGGHNVRSPGTGHCEQVGATLVALHLATENFMQKHPDKRGPNWREQSAEKVSRRLPGNDCDLLYDELERHKNIRPTELPRGTIHADLFRDNVLFDSGRLSGVIDFYYACDDDLIYDLAITVNDWCSRKDGSLNEKNYSALIRAYAERRPFSAAENDAWQDALRRAALRFWLSRLHDTHFPRIGQITHTKDADVFKNILLHRRREVPTLC